jgi:hypothetical protein
LERGGCWPGWRGGVCARKRASRIDCVWSDDEVETAGAAGCWSAAGGAGAGEGATAAEGGGGEGEEPRPALCSASWATTAALK